MVDPEFLARHVDCVLEDATIPELPNHYRGKVRDNYDLPDGRRIIIATDRLSAFDRAIAAIPFKGQVLTQTARFWFEQTADLCPNHVLDYPDPNVLVATRLDILPVEIVVRDYMAGTTATSIWSMYRQGRREMYGLRFPEELRENEKLPHSVITPTTKARDGEHDEPIAPNEIVGRGLMSAAQWDEVSAAALALLARGREIAARRGLILVDTKYEFGTDENGRLVLIDEIHTPDSSRYWLSGSYAERFGKGEEPQYFDKEFLRLWFKEHCDPYKDATLPAAPKELVDELSRRYIKMYEQITGATFQPGEEPIGPRIARNLNAYRT